MGLKAFIRSVTSPNQRATRKQPQKDRRDHAREKDGLLGIALKRGRMHSFTPDDLPAFYRQREERAKANQAQAQPQQQATKAEVYGDGRTEIPLGEKGENKIVVGEEKREALVVPRD